MAINPNGGTWWSNIAKVEPATYALARKIAERTMDPDQSVLPYQAAFFSAPNGMVTLVPPHDLVPYWSTHVSLARMALEARDDHQVSELLPDAMPEPSSDLPVAFTDQTPEDKWRREIGLEPEA